MSKDKPDTNPNVPKTLGAGGVDTKLRDYLSEIIERKRESHPCFRLIDFDDIDSRLYPNIEEYKQEETSEAISSDSNNLNNDNCLVWEVIRNSWSETKHRNVVIVGEGGIGKTVILFSITHSLNESTAVPAMYIPMYELVNKSGELLELSEYIAKKYKEHSDEIGRLATEKWNGKPRLLVLLDGFNEVPYSLRWSAIGVVNEWYTSHPGAQMIVASRRMVGIELADELNGDPILISLTPLEDSIIRTYLREFKRQIPSAKSPIWEDLRYPLFLNLYIKTRRLKGQKIATYPLHIMEADSGGALIWNFLQRELMRHYADNDNKDIAEKWVIRCAITNEYILPYLAYRMVSVQRMDVSYDQAIEWIEEVLNQFNSEKTPKHIKIICDKYKRKYHSVLSIAMFSREEWLNTVLRETGILVPKSDQIDEDEEEEYEFMNQHFRDCLAGLYLVNEAEMSEELEFPMIWCNGQSHLALDYAAELMDEHTADKLWNANRLKHRYTSPGYEKNHAGTCTLLELQKRRKSLPEKYDFSGMDISTLSLTRYMDKKEDALPLFQIASLTRDTKMSRVTFQSEGHTRRVNCIAALPDGRVISGSGDNTLRVWDASTGQCLQRLEGHSGWIRCLAVFPDGRVVSGSDDKTLRIWNPWTGQLLKKLEGHTEWVNCVAILPDGNVVSGSSDGTLRIWDSKTGQCIRILEGHTGAVLCIAVCSDGCIVSGSRDRTLRIWNPITKECPKILEGHSGRIICVDILPDGHVISGSYDKTLKVWDPLTAQCLKTLKGHNDRVRCVSVLSNRRVISGSDDKTLRVWDPSTGKCLSSLERHNDWILCMAILNEDKNTVVSGSGDGTLRVWDYDKSQCLQSMEGHGDWVLCMAVLKDGRVASGSGDSTLRVWDPLTGKCLQTLEGHGVRVRCVAALNDGKLVSGSEDRILRIWDLSAGKRLQTLEGHDGQVLCIAVLPDGRLVSGSSDNELLVWDYTTGQCMKSLEGHEGWVRCVTVFSDGRVVSGSADKTLRIWNSAIDQCLKILRGHDGRVRCVAVLSDDRVVSGSDDATLRIWNSTTGRCLKILKGHKGSVNCVAVLPDGNVVSGSHDKTLKVWNPLTGKCLRTLEGHDGRIQCVAVLDDDRLVSGSEDKNLRVWNLKNGDSQLLLKGHDDWVNCVTVLSDGSIVSGSGDGTLKVWDSNTGKCVNTLEAMEIDVSKMDLSYAVLLNDLAKPLRQNGAIITEADS